MNKNRKTSYYLPPNIRRKEIYHENWIDFNKNGVKDPYEDPSLPIEKRVEDLLSRITLNPRILVGKPTIRGMRITVEHILRALSGGVSEQELLEAYPQLTAEDIRAALSEAVRCGADPSRLGVLGHSVGGAGTIHAAANDGRIRAVVTVGAFAHPRDMTFLDLSRRNIPRPLARLILAYVQHNVGVSLDEIAPENNIGRITVPRLLVHGEEDEIVPVEHARRLGATAGPSARLLVLPGRGHSDCDEDPAFWPAVLEHLELALVP